MSILLIGQAEEDQIAVAIQRALARPTPWEALAPFAEAGPSTKLMLADRQTGIEEVIRAYPSQNVMLGTYRAAISFEQQPAGLMRHLSVSSARPGMVPGPEVLHIVAEAFGFSKTICDAFLAARDRKSIPLDHPGRVWAEEFDPGHMAINLVELVS